MTSWASGTGPPVPAEVESVVWWYVARASGLITWALLGVSVLGGLLLATKSARRRPRTWTSELHQFVAALAVIFMAIHLAAVLAADQLRIGLRELLVPFARPVNPVAQGCGVLACYLLTAVALTSWARARLPWRWWRRMHLLVYPGFGLACAHAALAGSDIGHPVLRWTGLVVGVVILVLAALRLRTARPAGPTAASPSAPLPAQTGMRLLISQTTWEADNVMSLRLRSPHGAALPRWEPGAHIELVLPSGRCRQYSLCGDPNDTRSYRIAVLRSPAGRGGSAEVHAGARAGQLITVRGPRNHFPLVAGPAYLFIAGGIGITAMLAMVDQVAGAGREWKLVYTGRRRTSMAFLDEVHALGHDRIDVVAGDERDRLDLDALIGAAPPGTVVYCCCPDRLLRVVREQVAARPDLSLHSELFVGELVAGGGATGSAAFHVELHRTGLVIDVPGDRSVLQAVRDVLPAVPAGCEQGVCGACRTTVLAGEPDHRDELLSSAERAAGTMLICVSRARSGRLTLDL